MNTYDFLPKILIASENPPKSYISALVKNGLDFECSIYPNSISSFHGLLLVGGGDVFPPYYHGKTPSVNVNFVKDKLEFNLIEKFFSLNLPIVAICRGIQLLNVFFGGTLKRVYKHSNKTTDIYHKIAFEKNVFGNLTEVNSAHRQAISRLAPNAEICAVASDGTIECALFGKNALGSQFHPERLNDYAAFCACDFFKRDKTCF